MNRSADALPSQAKTIYRIERLTQSYGGRRVLEIEQLEIRGGEILGLVGPSGSGKSTLLRLLNFLEPPSSGEIEFEGQRFANGRECRSSCAAR